MTLEYVFLYAHMGPINCDCVVSYMASMYKISDELDEKTIREEARVTLSGLEKT